MKRPSDLADHCLNAVQRPAVDDGVRRDVAAVGIQPGVAARVCQDAAGALEDEAGRGDVPNLQIEMPVGVHSAAGHIADSQRR